MDLKNIQNPEFLKSMSIDELEQLSGEIRQFLIQSISKTGGHLASNLGVVELTIALHYVFNAPVFLETIKQKIEKDHNLYVVCLFSIFLFCQIS